MRRLALLGTSLRHGSNSNPPPPRPPPRAVLPFWGYTTPARRARLASRSRTRGAGSRIVTWPSVFTSSTPQSHTRSPPTPTAQTLAASSRAEGSGCRSAEHTPASTAAMCRWRRRWAAAPPSASVYGTTLSCEHREYSPGDASPSLSLPPPRPHPPDSAAAREEAMQRECVLVYFKRVMRCSVLHTAGLCSSRSSQHHNLDGAIPVPFWVAANRAHRYHGRGELGREQLLLVRRQ